METVLGWVVGIIISWFIVYQIVPIRRRSLSRPVVSQVSYTEQEAEVVVKFVNVPPDTPACDAALVELDAFPGMSPERFTAIAADLRGGGSATEDRIPANYTQQEADMKRDTMTFDQWEKHIDERLAKMLGGEQSDLPDWNSYYGPYDSGHQELPDGWATMTFDQWIKHVDEHLAGMLDVEQSDLPDIDWDPHGAYDSGATPVQAARVALRVITLVISLRVVQKSHAQEDALKEACVLLEAYEDKFGSKPGTAGDCTDAFEAGLLDNLPVLSDGTIDVLAWREHHQI